MRPLSLSLVLIRLLPMQSRFCEPLRLHFHFGAARLLCDFTIGAIATVRKIKGNRRLCSETEGSQRKQWLRKIVPCAFICGCCCFIFILVAFDGSTSCMNQRNSRCLATCRKRAQLICVMHDGKMEPAVCPNGTRPTARQQQRHNFRRHDVSR